MELRNLITFIHVAELGTFTKAAEQLDYSQSTISFQIKQLEDELGCLLFERINHTINNYNDMLAEFQNLLNTQKEHEAQKRNLQLKVLQEQIKPHFLYSTLELINNAAILTIFLRFQKLCLSFLLSTGFH